MTNEEISFSFFLNNRVKDRGLNLKKLSELSGISIKHLEALSRGDFWSLPAAPYLRGYLIKLGEALDFDPNPWWAKIKAAGFTKNSGAEDVPPKNRFVKPQFLKFIWAASLSLVVIIYLFIQLPKIVGKPALQIIYPDKNPAVSTSSSITISGTISNWNELTLNGETISVNQDGSWEKIVLLESGLNTLEIKAKKFLGRETKILEQIIYQPTSTPISSE